MHFGGFWYVLENLRTSENISLRSVNIATKFERERERDKLFTIETHILEK